MARYAKHEHKFGIISHSQDGKRLLVMCQSPLTCVETQVWDSTTHRVKIGERKYRSQTPQEFVTLARSMEHLCCRP